MTSPDPDERTAAHRRPPSSLSTPTAEPIVGETPVADKQLATLIARAALVGAVLVLIDDDAGRPLYVASCGPWTRSMHSVAEVETFLARLGGLPKA